MKRFSLCALLVAFLLSCSFHFGLRYLSFTKQLGLTPIISLIKADGGQRPRKEILKFLN